MIHSFALLAAATVAHTQGVSHSVAHFIEQFSLAATEVDLRPEANGVYPHRRDLARTLLDLARTNDATLDQSFVLLDKNRSVQRLAAGDLLLILLFKIPTGVNWSDPSKLALRNVLVPVGTDSWESPTWPWIDQQHGFWKLSAFSVLAATSDKSLVAHLQAYRAQFQRRKFDNPQMLGS